MGISTVSRILAILPLVFGLSGPALAAGTDSPAPISFPLKVQEGRLTSSPDLGPLLEAAGVEALDSGFTTTVLLAFRWEESGATGLPTLPLVEIRLRYDVWAEAWWLSIGEAGKEQKWRFDSRDEAVRRAGNPGPIALADMNALPEGTPLAIQVRAVLNPISSEELARVEEWLRKPDGTGTGVGLVGTMIGYLVDERSGFSTKSLEGRTARFRREGGTVHATD